MAFTFDANNNLNVNVQIADLLGQILMALDAIIANQTNMMAPGLAVTREDILNSQTVPLN